MNNEDREYYDIYEVKECRICGSKDCYEVLNLGHHPLADTFLSIEQLSDVEVHYPLRVQTCPNCGLMQTRFVVSKRIRYQKNPYCYESASSLTALRHFSSLSKDVSSYLNLSRPALVVDVGSNDGTLLRAFRGSGCEVIGIDPSPNICKIANERGTETLNDFFNLRSAQEIIKRKGKASVVTATNLFNHIDDLDGFMEAIDMLLVERGAFVIEVPYLLDLIENFAYDTIYLEHVSYFSVKSLKIFFSRVKFDTFRVERTDYMGGSIRLFVGRKGEHQVDASVGELINMEKAKNLHNEKTFKRFANSVYRARDELVWLLYELKREGKRIVGVGAPTKGNSLLNFCRISTNVLDFVSDRIPSKVGRFTPGSHIPIVDDEMIRKTSPDYALLFSWNLADEIIKKFSESLKFKGKFIIPIPTPRIISLE